MMIRPRLAALSTPLLTAALATLAALHAPAAQAQATIDQTKALAGNVTPGDAAGFPITISQPGSYKLISNLYVPAGTAGIVITARGVTLDLNGFTVRSTNSCSQNASTRVVTCTEATTPAQYGGIQVDAAWPTGVVVRNGVVQGFHSHGLFVNDGTALTDLMVMENGATGIAQLQGTHGLGIERVVTTLNRSHGIFANRSVISHVQSFANGGAGFFTSASVVESSTARYNQGVGIYAAHVTKTVAAGNVGGDTSNVTSLGGNVKGSTVY